MATIDFVTPASVASVTPISIDISDPDGLGFVLITAEFAAGVREIVFDGSLGTKYQGASNTITNITDGFRYTILRDGGWLSSALSFSVVVYDAHATPSKSTAAQVYTITPLTAPEAETDQPEIATTIGWAIDGDGDLLRAGGRQKLTSGLAGVSQRIQTRMNFFLGEYYADTSIGVPYYQQILVKNPNLALIRESFRQRMLTVPYVKSIDALELTVNRASRALTVNWEITTEFGTLSDIVTLGVE